MHTYTFSSETHLWHRHLQSHPPFSPGEKQETKTNTHTHKQTTHKRKNIVNDLIKELDSTDLFNGKISFKHDVVQ